MGRSAEHDRDVLALPMQRPRRRVSGGDLPSRVHPPSFDPDAARKAWRQVARVRGGGPGLGVDPGQRRPPVAALLGVLLATGVVWGLWSMAEPPRDTAPPVEVAAATATEAPDRDAMREPDAPAMLAQSALPASPDTPRPGTVPMPASSIGTFTPKTPGKTPGKSPGRIAPPATEDATQLSAPRPKPSSSWSSAIPMPSRPEIGAPAPNSGAPEEPAAEPVAPGQAATQPAPGPRPAPPLIQRGPAAPPGSPSAGVAALRKLPKSERDRPPLHGVGVSGIHVDRLDLGSAYDDGVCLGSNRSYAVSATKTVNVCFRAVHRRQTERVLVKWSKNGRLVRRAWVVIPAAHAYRTRAGIRLRDSHVGNWSVSVESNDGIVLASGDFKVTP